jgi:hypothetical protein
MGYMPGTASKSWKLKGNDFTKVGGTWIHSTVFKLFGALRNVSHFNYTGALETLWRGQKGSKTGRPNRDTFMRQFAKANSAYTVRMKYIH